MDRARAAVVLASLAMVLGACLGISDPSLDPSPPPSASVEASPSAAASVEPSVEPSAPASTEPTPSLDVPSPGPPDSPAPSDSPAAVCTGTDANRDFYEAVAVAVAWDVYCAVLPSGWFVDSGRYRLAGGGSMEITYKGPGGARFGLREGVFCTEGASACAPRDESLGPAFFGDLEGELVVLGGDYAIHVDPGSSPSWQATAEGLDEATFRAFAEALALVPG